MLQVPNHELRSFTSCFLFHYITHMGHFVELYSIAVRGSDIRRRGNIGKHPWLGVRCSGGWMRVEQCSKARTQLVAV